MLDSISRLRRPSIVVAVLVGVCAWGPVAQAAPGKHTPKGKSVALKSGTLTVTFDPAVWAALTKSSTTGAFSTTNTVTAVAPGTVGSSGVATFPVTGGKLNAKALLGTVKSTGGLTFSSMSTNPLFSGGSNFSLTTFGFGILPAPATPFLTATFVGSNTQPGQQIATLSIGKAKHSQHGKKVTITGIELKCSVNGVTLFSGEDPAVKAGSVLGTASLTASG